MNRKCAPKKNIVTYFTPRCGGNNLDLLLPHCVFFVQHCKKQLFVLLCRCPTEILRDMEPQPACALCSRSQSRSPPHTEDAAETTT